MSSEEDSQVHISKDFFYFIFRERRREEKERERNINHLSLARTPTGDQHATLACALTRN